MRTYETSIEKSTLTPYEIAKLIHERASGSFTGHNINTLGDEYLKLDYRDGLKKTLLQDIQFEVHDLLLYLSYKPVDLDKLNKWLTSVSERINKYNKE